MERHLGIRSISLQPPRTAFAGAFPQCREPRPWFCRRHPVCRVRKTFRLFCEAFRTLLAGAFIAPACRPDFCSFALPVSGRFAARECSAPLWFFGFPRAMPRFFTPPAFRSRSVPSGQAMVFVLPPLRRRASHAGRDGRLDERWSRTGYLTDAMMNHRIMKKSALSVAHWRPSLLSERLGSYGKRALHGLRAGNLLPSGVYSFVCDADKRCCMRLYPKGKTSHWFSFIRSRFSGCFVNREGLVFPVDCFVSVRLCCFQHSPGASRRGARPFRGRGIFPLSLTAGLGYHRVSGLSFNLRLNLLSAQRKRRRHAFSPFPLNGVWQKMRSPKRSKPMPAVPVCGVNRCCQTFPFHYRV